MDRKDHERSKLFPHLGAAFRTNVEQFGPNDFFVMQKCMKEVRREACSAMVEARVPVLKSMPPPSPPACASSSVMRGFGTRKVFRKIVQPRAPDDN